MREPNARAEVGMSSTTIRRVTVQNPDGDVHSTTLAEFFEANEGLSESDEGAIIRNLPLYGKYTGGGGAAPRWSIERTA
jgi:hypothetical protein